MKELSLPREAEVSQRGADTASFLKKPRGANWLFILGTCIILIELK